MNILRTLAILPILIGVSSTAVSAAPIDIEAVIAELQPQTDLPIWLPDEIPQMEQVYISLDTTADSYYIGFYYIPDCTATACRYGSFSADRNGEFATSDVLNPFPRSGIPVDEIRHIRFDNGMSGQFVNTCGSYCIARVQWRLGGILYDVEIKNGRQSTVIDLANAILDGDIRAQGSVQPSLSN
jgi:hypothetical protein